ncbi:hypothetical protein BVC80_8509g6 [Macleaya cordata]|uniref:Sugar phosphate transporter domain-containing protein n=1 Tax=Macleaya cordata TaxID=56857 RepID=A0A200QAU3_MACCD|nr:hypothetical protein BVC80_8509g6 [Macleaya cordata]
MPSGVPLDTPDPVLERHLLVDTSKTQNVERFGFSSREQNGVVDQISSPLLFFYVYSHHSVVVIINYALPSLSFNKSTSLGKTTHLSGQIIFDIDQPNIVQEWCKFLGEAKGKVEAFASLNVVVELSGYMPLPIFSLVATHFGEALPLDTSLSSMKTLNNDGVDMEVGKVDKDRDKTIRSIKLVKVQNQALLSGLAYCISSCSMILINKFVLSSYDFNAGISLMLYQNLVSVVIVSSLSFFGVISTEPLTWKLMRVWLPVNFIFVGMLITSLFSLKYINVAMVTVLKNVTNVITALGEMYLFKKHHDSRVWAALFLMILSAISGGITDLSFHAVGYTWQIINCFLTASYSLTLRRVMDTAKQVTKSGNLNEFSMVLLNNTLSLPLGVLLIFVFNEVDYLSQTPLLKMPVFWLVMTSSGLLGLAISFTSMWFLHQTGATTYRMKGKEGAGLFKGKPTKNFVVFWQGCSLPERKCGKNPSPDVTTNCFVPRNWLALVTRILQIK